MESYRLSCVKRKTFPQSWPHLSGFAAACMMLAGCGPAGDTPRDGVAVAQSAAAVTVDCSTIQPSHTAVDVKGIMTLAKDVADTIHEPESGNPIQVVIDIFDFFSGPTVDDKIDALNAKLFCLARALDWKPVALDYNTNQFAPVSAAFMEAQSVGFARGSFYDGSSHDATVASGGLVMFERLYDPNDPATNGQWKNIITNKTPDVIDVNQIFDWRMAFPGFARLLATRLALIGMMDPNFRTDGLWNAELGDGSSGFPGYRGVLKARLDQMVAGVRCDYKDRTRIQFATPPGRGFVTVYVNTDIACADVNTGVSQTTSITRPDGASCAPSFTASCMAGLASQATVTSNMDSLRRGILNSMPVFEVQSMIDTLYLFTHPAPDLTRTYGRIPLAADATLCLDDPGASAASGTALQIYGCHGGIAQQFSYDRIAQTIVNTAVGKCLQVRPSVFVLPFVGTIFIDNPSPGAIAEIADCDATLPRQKWTYDAEGRIIRDALGTVLDVQWGNLQSGTPVWLWDYNGGNAQRWRADHDSNYCSGICYPSCESACAGAGPGTGPCIGSCMGGCVQGCMNSWP